MAVKEGDLTKGQLRKLNALRKSIGDDLAEEAFEKWLRRQKSAQSDTPPDPTAVRLEQVLNPIVKDKSLNLGRYGYTIKRAKGKGASGIVVVRNAKP